MTIVPRILFLLQMVPVHLPRRFFIELRSLFIKFVWDGKRPRLAMALLHRSKLTEGLGIPNVFQYYQAIALQRVLNWRFHTTLKLWVLLEKTMACRDLSYAPCVPTGDRGFYDLVSPITIHSLRVWDRVKSNLALAPQTSPLAPVGGSPHRRVHGSPQGSGYPSLEPG